MVLTEAPIIGCEINKYNDVLEVKSNIPKDGNERNLNRAKELYEDDKDADVIYIGIEYADDSMCCMGLSIDDAEELNTALTSIINIIKGE